MSLEVTTARIDVPTPSAMMEAWFAAIGAVSFVLGSVGFIWSSWDNANWLLPFQIGCAIWIFGCAMFLFSIGASRSLSLKQQQQIPSINCCRFWVSWWTVSEVCQVACQLLFLVGCSLAFGSADDVVAHLATISAVFLAGSLLLAVDVFHTALQKEAMASKYHILRDLATWDALTAIAFVYAAVVGGYGHTTNLLRAGMPGWTIGSIASGITPIQRLMQWRTKMTNQDGGESESTQSAFGNGCSQQYLSSMFLRRSAA